MSRKCLQFIALLVPCILNVTAHAQSDAWVEATENAKKAVVKITVKTRYGGGGTGTGFVCNSSGQVITNLHVVSSATAADVDLSDQNGTSFKCFSIYRIRGHRSDLDIAILNTSIKGVEPLCLLQREVYANTRVSAIGHPLGQSVSVSQGVISSSKDDHYQFDAGINPGNSGGPVIDVNGRVVGVVESKNTSAEGIAFAIRSDTLIEVLSSNGIKFCANDDKVVASIRDTLTSIASMWTYYNQMMILAADRLGLSASAGDPIDVRIRHVSDEIDRRSKVLSKWQDSITVLQNRVNQLRQQAYPEHFTFEVALHPSWSLLRYQSTASDMIGLRGELGLAYIIGGNTWSHPDRIGLMVAMQGWRSIDGSPSPTGYLYDLSTYLEFAERVRVIIGIGNTGRFEIRSHENYLYGSVAYNIVRGSLPLGVRAGISSSNDGKLTIISAGIVGAFRTDFFRW